MANLVNFVLFQALWFAAVAGGARGEVWWGPAALVPCLVGFLWTAPDVRRSLVFVLTVGLVGTLLDTVLLRLGLLGYESGVDTFGLGLVPPWIVSLWVGFATLPGRSMGWLASRPGAAAVFGLVGGPLSFMAGERMGATAWAGDPWAGAVALGIEYALLMPLLLRLGARS